MVPYVYGQVESACTLWVCVCFCGHGVCIYIPTGNTHESNVCVCCTCCVVSITFYKKDSPRWVSKSGVGLLMFFWLCWCCGWAGRGRRPWCGCLCNTLTHGNEGMRLHHQKMSGNLVFVWAYSVTFNGLTWPNRSLCVSVSLRYPGNICYR